MEIRFTVHGRAQSRGSKVAIPVGKRGGGYVTDSHGRPIISQVDANKKSAGWMRVVGQAAGEVHRGPLLERPVVLTVRCYFIRPKSHYRSGKNSHLLKDDAPSSPIGRNCGDLSKLLRGIEDGITGVVWRDDSQVARYGEGTGKYWGESEHVEIEIREL